MAVTESPRDPASPVTTRALIIGTGFSGLGMGIALQRRGIDFLMLEKADDIGGTWRDNIYPGCACDIPSHLYSYSFEPKPDWHYLFSYQPEIFDYLLRVTAKHGLRRHIVFGATVVAARWDDAEYRWHVHTADGREYIAQFLISAAGALHIPSVPDFAGLDEFRAGPGRAFHSAQWDPDVDLTGKTVAVIGTGASAIQIVPEIVGRVGALHLYQRTPAWVVPRTNAALPPRLRTTLARIPGLRWGLRTGIYWLQEALAVGMTRWPALLGIGEVLGRWNIHRAVADRDLRRRLTPHYRLGCKRILNSSSYYPAIAEAKTELITDHIARFTADGIVTVDATGAEVTRRADVVVFATGFHVADSYTYVHITGAGGEDLVARWDAEGLAAHRGVTVADVPNLFFLLGPNTGLGHNSMVFMIESQVHYIDAAIAAVDRVGAQALAPTRAAQDRFNAALQHRLARSVWNTGGCASWYLDAHGHNPVLWGGYTWQYWEATRRVRPGEYHFLGVGSSA